MADGRAMKKMADTAGASAAALPDRARTRDLDVGRLLLEGRAFFALIVIVAVFSSLSPYYFSVGNFLTMASHVAIYGILAVGMLLVILSGGIDLSVGSTLGLSGVVAGFLMQGVTVASVGVTLYPPVWVVAVLTCVLGGAVGLVNGVLIARFKVPAFVATLGVMYVARGAALLITNGLTYNDLGGNKALGNTASTGSASTICSASRSVSWCSPWSPSPAMSCWHGPHSVAGSMPRAATRARPNCPACRSDRCRSASTCSRASARRRPG